MEAKTRKTSWIRPVALLGLSLISLYFLYSYSKSTEISRPVSKKSTSLAASPPMSGISTVPLPKFPLHRLALCYTLGTFVDDLETAKSLLETSATTWIPQAMTINPPVRIYLALPDSHPWFAQNASFTGILLVSLPSNQLSLPSTHVYAALNALYQVHYAQDPKLGPQIDWVIHLPLDSMPAPNRLAEALASHSPADPHLFGVPAPGIPLSREALAAQNTQKSSDRVIVGGIDITWEEDWHPLARCDSEPGTIFSMGLLHALFADHAKIDFCLTAVDKGFDVAACARYWAPAGYYGCRGLDQRSLWTRFVRLDVPTATTEPQFWTREYLMDLDVIKNLRVNVASRISEAVLVWPASTPERQRLIWSIIEEDDARFVILSEKNPSTNSNATSASSTETTIAANTQSRNSI